MSTCPFCGNRIDNESDKCGKCGALLSKGSPSKGFRCSKCGGTLEGTESNCPFCGIPCTAEHAGEFSGAYARLRAQIAVNVNVPYGVLRLKCPNENRETVQMEFSLGGIGDVVRSKPVFAEKELPNDKLAKIEIYMRELLQVMASNPIGQTVVNFSNFVVNAGRIIYSLFPDRISNSLWNMNEGSLLALELDDNLVGLPWELAFNESEFLCTRLGMGRIIYSENARFERRRPGERTRVLVISNPDNKLLRDTENVALPIKEKLEKLGAIVDHMYYQPGSAFHTSKGNVLEAFGSGLYDIIHFTGHGRFDERFPEKSCFALADGELLFAHEISGRLEKAIHSGKEAPFLFYADSCEAGAQRGWDMKTYRSQVLGLAEALIRFNVAYIGAFWSANIEASTKLALSFYKALLDRKEPLGTALRNAKLAIWTDPNLGPDHPNCEWANFALYGDPSLTIRI